MQAPVIILSAASFWIIISWNPFVLTRWLNPSQAHNWSLTVFSMLWISAALTVAYVTRRNNVHNAWMEKSFYIDRLYQLFTHLLLRFAKATSHIDTKWIDGFIHASAYAQVLLAHVTAWFDRALVDGTVNGFATVVRGVGTVTRSFQDGKIQLYIFWSIFTIIIFLIWTLL
jgi:NADH-quinone oxidoreductase subunit L